ncbi:MAG: phage baseplate assembly protein V [Thermoanaerobaculia bacterium]
MLDDATPPTDCFFGKYRGVVTNNIDPLGLHRIMVNVPAVPHALLTWAHPCVPYAGKLVGHYTIPEIGSNVWVEFEGGNPSQPIWTGCYWEEFEFTEPLTANPVMPALAKMLKTLTGKFMLNDTPAVGGMELESLPPAVPIPTSLKFDVDGAEMAVGPTCTITMNAAEGIKLQMGPNSIEITLEGITLTAPKISLTALESVSVTAASGVEMTAGESASIQAGASAEVKAAGGVTVEGAGPVSVKSAAATTVEGGATLDLKGGGAVSVTGAIVNIN